MERLIRTILSVIVLLGFTFTSGFSTTPPPPANSSIKLKSFSSNRYNKEIDYNWYGWQKYSGQVEVGEDFVVLPDGKGRFELDTENPMTGSHMNKEYISFFATNESGEKCKISITCFKEGKCIIVLCYDQKSWAYKCSEPISMNFKPMHTVW